MTLNRRECLAAAGLWGLAAAPPLAAAAPGSAGRESQLTITGLKVTPIALPDPPILAHGGCHGPYFLRNVVEIETDGGLVGIGETHGGQRVTQALEASRKLIVGQSAFAYRKFAAEVGKLSRGCFAGIELACLDAIGRATGRRLCELLGGPVRERIELSSYLFFRYAADHPKLLADPRIVDGRGRGDRALDAYGEVLTPEAMAELAWTLHQQYGFRCHKLKAGPLPPDVELAALQAINDRFGGQHALRIDPNGRWTVYTAVRIGAKLADLPLQYYEDPVLGQRAMADVREETGLKMSTNMCVTEFGHIASAVRTGPIDVVLCDHHGWGGITACQSLGAVAEALGWGVSQHSNSHAGITMAAMLHVAAVVPQLTYATDTHYPWLADAHDIITGGKWPIRDGAADVPRAPGVGVELDRDHLARAHEVYLKCGVRQRDDAYTMRLVDPAWQRHAW